MNNHKGIIVILMTILIAGFIAFVIIMQHKFMNPDFAAADASTEVNSEQSPSDSNNKEAEQKEKDEAEPNNETANAKEEAEDASGEDLPTTMYVTASILNVRGGPGTDTEIIGGVTLNQEVEVEDINDPDGWVKIKTDEFTGYVNIKYLSDEQQ
ncbi:SH3 domain-containing protein [Oceanobacillus piezotolerans]|nr:SH3 domain-containing protein [Oceanobacillus piezotolerans]